MIDLMSWKTGTFYAVRAGRIYDLIEEVCKQPFLYEEDVDFDIYDPRRPVYFVEKSHHYNDKAITKFIQTGEHTSRLLGDLLIYLCRKDLIEEGAYILI